MAGRLGCGVRFVLLPENGWDEVLSVAGTGLQNKTRAGHCCQVKMWHLLKPSIIVETQMGLGAQVEEKKHTHTTLPWKQNLMHSTGTSRAFH